MNKHTPGPWKVCTEAPNTYWTAGLTIGAGSPDDGRRVCDVWQWGDDPTEGMTAANARIISLSPEFFEALETIVDRFMPCREDYKFSQRLALDKAAALIAKAKGQTP